ncbi:MAG TPA: hypothetical protein VND65_20920 [Candidatus Binatia bacterium]|nr:hypothetical protein [Candidatus Binatia bacterium]
MFSFRTTVALLLRIGLIGLPATAQFETRANLHLLTAGPKSVLVAISENVLL